MQECLRPSLFCISGTSLQSLSGPRESPGNFRIHCHQGPASEIRISLVYVWSRHLHSQQLPVTLVENNCKSGGFRLHSIKAPREPVNMGSYALPSPMNKNLMEARTLFLKTPDDPWLRFLIKFFSLL